MLQCSMLVAAIHAVTWCRHQTLHFLWRMDLSSAFIPLHPEQHIEIMCSDAPAGRNDGASSTCPKLLKPQSKAVCVEITLRSHVQCNIARPMNRGKVCMLLEAVGRSETFVPLLVCMHGQYARIAWSELRV